MTELYLAGGIIVALVFAFWVGYELGKQRAARPISGGAWGLNDNQAQMAHGTFNPVPKPPYMEPPPLTVEEREQRQKDFRP